MTLFSAVCGINAPRIVIKLLYVSLLLITALRNLLNLLNLHTFPPLDISLGRANYYRKKKTSRDCKTCFSCGRKFLKSYQPVQAFIVLNSFLSNSLSCSFQCFSSVFVLSYFLFFRKPLPIKIFQMITCETHSPSSIFISRSLIWNRHSQLNIQIYSKICL